MSNQQLDELYQYLYVGSTPVDLSLNELERARDLVQQFALVVKAKHAFSEISRFVAPYMTREMQRRRGQKPAGSQVREAQISEASGPVAPPPGKVLDRARIGLLTLQCRDAMIKALDWDHYARFVNRDVFRRARADIDQMVSALEALSSEEFFDKQDTSRLFLDYYKVMDPLRRQTDVRLHMYVHAWFLRHYFEIAGRLVQKSSETVTGYFDRIVHSIQFPPQFYRAGIGILGHFNSILRQKYPDLRARVRIEQDDMIVRMIIDTPEGTREIIEQALDKYMEVVRGNVLVEELLSDKADAMEMRHVMQMMRMTIEHQRDMIQLQRTQLDGQGKYLLVQGSQLSTLIEGQGLALKYVGETISNIRDDAREWRELVLTEMISSSDEVKHALLIINHAVEHQKIANEADFREAVRLVNIDRPGLFERIHAQLAKAAVSGAIGNAFYAWLVSVISVLPK